MNPACTLSGRPDFEGDPDLVLSIDGPFLDVVDPMVRIGLG